MKMDFRLKADRKIVHGGWVRDFWATIQQTPLAQFYPRRRRGLSVEKKKHRKTLSRFEAGLLKLCEKHGWNMEIGVDKVRPYKRGNLVSERIAALLEGIRMEKEFYKRMHQSHTDGRGRAVPEFIAYNILLGLMLHDRDTEGQDLMRVFLSKRKWKTKEAGLYAFCMTRINGIEELGSPARRGLEEMAEALCDVSGGIDTSTWTKRKKEFLLDNIEAGGKAYCGKRSSGARREIMGEIRERALRYRAALLPI